jgi:hypothetical protein
MHTIVESHARHRNAVASYTTTAAAIPADRWQTPRGEGKWSPAEITAHLTLTFDAICRELRGEGSMQPRLTGWKLMLARLTVMRRILADGSFYTGARAPRETRPEGALKPQDVALRELRDAAARLEKQFDATAAAQPDFKLAHPYFGAIGIGDAIFMSARHVEHHQTQLPGI